MNFNARHRDRESVKRYDRKKQRREKEFPEHLNFALKKARKMPGANESNDDLGI